MRGYLIGLAVLWLALAAGLAIQTSRDDSGRETDRKITAAVFRAAQDRQTASRASCERGKQDRRDSASGWGIARDTRLRAASLEHGAARVNDLDAASKYGDLVRSFQSRLLNCDVTFPPLPVPEGLR